MLYFISFNSSFEIGNFIITDQTTGCDFECYTGLVYHYNMLVIGCDSTVCPAFAKNA